MFTRSQMYDLIHYLAVNRHPDYIKVYRELFQVAEKVCGFTSGCDDIMTRKKFPTKEFLEYEDKNLRIIFLTPGMSETYGKPCLPEFDKIVSEAYKDVSDPFCYMI